MEQAMPLNGDGNSAAESTKSAVQTQHYWLLAQKLRSQKLPMVESTLDHSAPGNADVDGTPACCAGPRGWKKTGLRWCLAAAGLAIMGTLVFQWAEKSQEKSLRILQANRLKTIGLAARVWAS